jgi:PAS domain S-box-containing protein
MKLRIYIAGLGAVLTAVLVGTLLSDAHWGNWTRWALFTGLYILTESAVLLFHHERGRVGISAAEAIFLPMLIALSFPQIVWGIAVGATMVSLAQLRLGPEKAVFNVVNFGVASAAASGLYWWLVPDGTDFGIGKAAVAIGAVILFTVLTHLFVSLAIALAEDRSFFELWRDVALTTGLNLMVNICLGLLLAASYSAARWTIVIFPVALALFLVASRAIFRQLQEAERVEYLLSASRALAASPSLKEALDDFLVAAQEITSAREARAVVETPSGVVWSAVREGVPQTSMEPLDEGPLKDVVGSVERARSSFLAKPGNAEHDLLLKNLDARSLLAVPLFDDEMVVGCLVAMDRIGTGEFGGAEGQMLEALGHELVLTLDSYRLFEEVREERARFRRIFNASKEGICLLDENGVVRAWNPSLVRITGFDAEQITGKRWSDVVTMRTKAHQRIEGMAIATVEADDELEVVRDDGPSRWVSVVSSPIEAGDEIGWVVQVRDVTAEHLAEEAKSDFLSTVSHELRTPLTTIKGSVGVLSRPADQIPPEMLDKMVGLLRRGTDRLERLVMNLLYVSQLDTEGELKLIPSTIDLAATVRERMNGAENNGAEIALDGPDSLAVVGDKRIVDLMVEHLLENAIKFGKGSPISVTVEAEDGFGELSVRDGGPGIAEVDQDRIFERFVRLGNVLTRETQGPGVGLFIVRRSAEAMGGRAWVESSPGEGATFHVTLPLASQGG